jgi:hypothetical protein
VGEGVGLFTWSVGVGCQLFAGPTVCDKCRRSQPRQDLFDFLPQLNDCLIPDPNGYAGSGHGPRVLSTSNVDRVVSMLLLLILTAWSAAAMSSVALCRAAADIDRGYSPPAHRPAAICAGRQGRQLSGSGRLRSLADGNPPPHSLNFLPSRQVTCTPAPASSSRRSSRGRDSSSTARRGAGSTKRE